MINLPDSAPWGAVLVLSIILALLGGLIALARAVWPQESRDRKELLEMMLRRLGRKRSGPEELE